MIVSRPSPTNLSKKNTGYRSRRRSIYIRYVPMKDVDTIPPFSHSSVLYLHTMKLSGNKTFEAMLCCQRKPILSIYTAPLRCVTLSPKNFPILAWLQWDRSRLRSFWETNRISISCHWVAAEESPKKRGKKTSKWGILLLLLVVLLLTMDTTVDDASKLLTLVPW